MHAARRTRPASAQASAPPGCTPTARSCTSRAPCRPAAVALRRGELLVEQPLQPACGSRPGRPAPAGARTTAAERGSRSPSGQVGQSAARAPRRARTTWRSRPAPRPRGRGTRRTRPRAARGQRHRVAAPARRAWRSRTASRSISVAGRRGRAARGQRSSTSAGRVGGTSAAYLGDVLDPQVERVDEAAGRRQVRRRLIGGTGSAACSGLTTRSPRRARPRPGGEVGQVGEVADAPGRRERTSRAAPRGPERQSRVRYCPYFHSFKKLLHLMHQNHILLFKL